MKRSLSSVLVVLTLASQLASAQSYYERENRLQADEAATRAAHSASSMHNSNAHLVQKLRTYIAKHGGNPSQATCGVAAVVFEGATWGQYDAPQQTPLDSIDVNSNIAIRECLFDLKDTGCRLTQYGPNRYVNCIRGETRLPAVAF